MNLSLSNLSSNFITGNAVGDTLGVDTTGTGILNGLMEVFARLYLYLIIIILALYVYLSIAYSKIGEKAKLGSPGIAWMPFIGPIVTIFETSKKHWWPFLMLTLGYALGILVMSLGLSDNSVVFYIGLGILVATFLIFTIMAIIWHWKTYEAIGRPGWWILIPVISCIVGYVLVYIGKTNLFMDIGVVIMGLGFISHLVLIGIAAWGEGETKSHQNYEQDYHQTPPQQTESERGYEEESYGQE